MFRFLKLLRDLAEQGQPLFSIFTYLFLGGDFCAVPSYHASVGKIHEPYESDEPDGDYSSIHHLSERAGGFPVCKLFKINSNGDGRGRAYRRLFCFPDVLLCGFPLNEADFGNALHYGRPMDLERLPITADHAQPFLGTVDAAVIPIQFQRAIQL